MSTSEMKEAVKARTGLTANEFDVALQAYVQDPRVDQKMQSMRTFQQGILKEIMQ